ncbi:MAG: AAA family ATPase, partial [Chloroflexota bacterium]|nr:AAA family ATPase [Chloroflexota bacterium]
MNAAPMNVLVVHTLDVDPSVIRALLSTEDLQVVGFFDGFGNHMPPGDVLVVACGSYTEEAGSLIREGVDERPDRPVLLVTQGAPNGYVDHAFKAGAADLMVLPTPCDAHLARAMSHQVLFTIRKAVQKRDPASSGSEGKMVVLVGPKGGSGKTLCSTNLAAALASSGQTVVVVDLDLQFGDVGLALGLTPEKTIYDLLVSGGSMDAEKVDA